jgi:hypothetical protein
MKTLRNGLGLWAVAIAILALPVAAPAATVVPPENSAATQYTEAIPTGGGHQDTDKAGNGKKRSPAAVLGSHKAKKLEAQGREGREVAEIVAETAPETSALAAEAPAPEPSPEAAPAPDASGGDNASLKAGVGPAKAVDVPGESELAVHRLDIPSGSSGLGEVLAQATGSSSTGQLGLLLPLLILATILWSLVYLRRQRRGTA